MSAGDITLKPSVLSAELWSIVNKDDTDQFPKAVQIAIKLFQILPNLVSVNSFCDLILDLKIKAFISTMSEEMDFNHAKASSLLNSLFPSIEEDIEIKSHKYWKRHIRVKKRLSRLLVEDESRLSYMRNYLKYGSCECLTKVIKGRVQKFNEVVTQHVETLGDTKPAVSNCEKRSTTFAGRLSPVTRSVQMAFSSCSDPKRGIQSNFSSPNSAKRDKDIERNLEHADFCAPHLHPPESDLLAVGSVKSLYNRKESKQNEIRIEYNGHKRRRLEANYIAVGGVEESLSDAEDLLSNVTAY